MTPKIERPDANGNGCSLDCGVAFVHTHPDGDGKHPVMYEEPVITDIQKLARDAADQIAEYAERTYPRGTIKQAQLLSYLSHLQRMAEIMIMDVLLREKVAQKDDHLTK